MAYTINRGYQDNHGFDRIQRGLLIGLPAIALILSFGAIRHHNPANTSAGENAELIPVVSSLSGNSDKDDTGTGDSNSSNTGGSNTSATGGGNVQGANTTVPSGGGTQAPAPVTGGMGGGGSTTIPDCSLNQIATVNCMVTSCSPPVTLAPGQKAILGVTGTCIIVN